MPPNQSINVPSTSPKLDILLQSKLIYVISAPRVTLLHSLGIFQAHKLCYLKRKFSSSLLTSQRADSSCCNEQWHGSRLITRVSAGSKALFVMTFAFQSESRERKLTWKLSRFFIFPHFAENVPLQTISQVISSDLRPIRSV